MKNEASLTHRSSTTLKWAAMVAISSCAMITPAMGDGVVLEGPGWMVEIDPGTMAGTLGDGIEVFSVEDLEFMHEELAADGITTSGHISVVTAWTDDGLALVNLFGGQNPLPGRINDTFLGFDSQASSIANRHWNLDSGGEMNWIDFGLLQNVNGIFEWEAGVTSEGFAWSNLHHGDVGTTSFVDLGLDMLIPDSMIQFISWNGMSWEVVMTDSFTPGSKQYNMSFYVDTIPAPAALPLLALGALARRRRRRS